MKISINCESVEISSNGRASIGVDITNCDIDEILDEFDESTIINHFSKEKMLDLIGKNEAMEYFDLIENNE